MPDNIKIITINGPRIDYGNALFYKNVTIDVLKSALLENHDRVKKVVIYHEFSNHELKGDLSAHLKMNNGHLNGIMQNSVFENVDISHMYLDLTNDITNCTFTNVDFSQTTCYINGTEILNLNEYLNHADRNNTITNVTFGDDDAAAAAADGADASEQSSDEQILRDHGAVDHDIITIKNTANFSETARAGKVRKIPNSSVTTVLKNAIISITNDNTIHDTAKRKNKLNVNRAFFKELFALNATTTRMRVSRADLSGISNKINSSNIVIPKSAISKSLARNDKFEIRTELASDEAMHAVFNIGEYMIISDDDVNIIFYRNDDVDDGTSTVESYSVSFEDNDDNVIQSDSLNINLSEIQSSNLNDLVLDDSFVYNNVTYIIGSVSAQINTIVVESTGDPYITPLHGNIYKLPNCTANYRAFEYDDVFINVLVDHLDITNEFNHYIKRSNLESRIELGTTPITSGYWNSKLYIESEGNVATLDIENKQITYNKQYFNMKIIDNEENSMFVEDGHHKAIAIEWTHSNYGWQRFVVSYYENPQHRNGLKFESTLIHKKSATGILIRNYKPKFMTLNKLETGYSKKLIAKSKAPNNMIVNKVISSKEKWISNKGTKTSKQVNKKYSKK